MNMALCLRRHSERAGYAAILKSAVPSVIVLVVLVVGILKFDDIEQRNEAHGYFIGAVQYVASDLMAFVNALPDGVIRIGVGVVTLLFFFLIVPLTPILLAYATVRFGTALRLDWNALALRLWRIVGGIAIVLALNYLSLWLEQQPWLGQLVK